MKSFFIISTYCTGNGRSSPNWWRIWARIWGLGLRPAICRAGSIPGVLKKITKTSSEMTNMTAIISSSRRTTKVSTPSPLHP